MAQLLDAAWVGPITALAFVVTIGDVSRFRRGKQVASYLGLIPRERSSGGRQRLGAISKQGNRFLRTLLVEAAHSANRKDEGFRKTYQQRCHRMAKGVAKVAAQESWPYDSTGCYAPTPGIQRSFRSRAARGCPWSAKARPMN